MWSLWLSMQVFSDHLSPSQERKSSVITATRRVSKGAAVLHKWQGSHQDGFAANTEDHLGDLGDQWDVEHRNRRVIPLIQTCNASVLSELACGCSQDHHRKASRSCGLQS